ncbi:MAG: hypothetical protein ACKO6L_01900 [Flavobacteriales bacterium]
MSNKVYIVVIAALMVVVGILLFKRKDDKKEIVYLKEEYANLDTDRQDLAVELESMKLQYDTMQVTNGEMQAKIDQQKGELASLLQKVKNRDYDISKLRAETETLRGIMKHYIYQIDSLNKLNIQLTGERDQQTQRADQAEARGQELESELTNSKEINAKGAILSTGEFNTVAIFERDRVNKGKQVETDRAAKAEIIKSCFKVRQNQIARSGSRTIYMAIVGPDGQVLSSSGSGNVTVNGSNSSYSVARDFDYNQSDTDVCIYYTANSGYQFKKGTYKINLYESGSVIGTSSFSLK